ncbi:MAG: DUF1311 domain-containing protein [Gammaproteobacteria bacterium]|nr:DUF1311 domain-containing protein [Gammaproteobacteria bacterium]
MPQSNTRASPIKKLLFAWRPLGAGILLGASIFISSCTEQSAQELATKTCGSEAGRDAFRGFVTQTALARDTTPDGVARLIDITRYASSIADEDLRPQFSDALSSLSNLSGRANFSDNNVEIIIKEVTERGVSENGEILCWASIDVRPAVPGTEALEGLADALSLEYDLSLPAVSQITSLPIFYAISDSEPVRVIDADLSARDAGRIGGLIRLVEGAPIVLAPVEAQKARREAYEKEVLDARGAVLSATLAEERYRLAVSKNALNDLWAELDEAARDKLSAQQSLWVRQRDARCDLSSKEAETDPNQREMIKVRCLANENERRIGVLQRYSDW